VLAIQRGEDVIIPHGSTRLQTGDRLTLAGDLEALQAAEDWLANRD
jgi:Trk K+ transport system NAD-binding subunit